MRWDTGRAKAIMTEETGKDGGVVAEATRMFHVAPLVYQTWEAEGFRAAGEEVQKEEGSDFLAFRCAWFFALAVSIETHESENLLDVTF